MTLNWNFVVEIAKTIILLFIGAWINRRFERRAALLSYFGHVSAFRHTPPGGQPLQVHTHSVILRNTGRGNATNVRLRHNTLPDFQIWPAVDHSVVSLPNNEGQEIVISQLLPGEQITISYLYFPPLTFAQINAGIRCDQGFAHQIPVLLQRQYPRWLSMLAASLMLTGIMAVGYLVYDLVRLAAATEHWDKRALVVQWTDLRRLEGPGGKITGFLFQSGVHNNSSRDYRLTKNGSVLMARPRARADSLEPAEFNYSVSREEYFLPSGQTSLIELLLEGECALGEPWQQCFDSYTQDTDSLVLLDQQKHFELSLPKPQPKNR